MSTLSKYLLPGLNKQAELLLKQYPVGGKSILILGAGSEYIAKKIADKNASSVSLIIENESSLVQSRFILSENSNVSVRLMAFDNTDFPPHHFDLVYAQASVSNFKRNKIIKEIKRILKPGGLFCTGEIVNLKEPAPAFVKRVWQEGGIVPLSKAIVYDFYPANGFEIIFEKDLSFTLKKFYAESLTALNNSLKEMSKEEKSYNKKLLNKIKHESNVYLKLGGDKFMGFIMLLLRKAAN